MLRALKPGEPAGYCDSCPDGQVFLENGRLGIKILVCRACGKRYNSTNEVSPDNIN